VRVNTFLNIFLLLQWLLVFCVFVDLLVGGRPPFSSPPFSSPSLHINRKRSVLSNPKQREYRKMQQPHSLLFLGTGTSGTVPAIHCLTTNTTTNKSYPCKTCLSNDPKNKRGNTSVAIYNPNTDMDDGCIIIGTRPSPSHGTNTKDK